MLKVISKEAVEDNAFSMEALEGYGLAGGTIAGGFIAAHVLNTLVNKARKSTDDSILVSGGMAAAGLAGAMFIKNGHLKLLSLGVMSYGVVKSLSIGLKEVTTAVDPNAAKPTSGLAGLLPETIKAKLREFIPTIGSVDQLIGDENERGINGDDFGNIFDEHKEVNGNEEEPVNGLGIAENLI